jgi:hypothetical protein
MSRLALSPRLLLACMSALVAFSKAYAVVPEFTWSGRGVTWGNYFDPRNWVGGVVPPNDGTARIIFGPSGKTQIYYMTNPWEISVEGIRFAGITQPYYFYGSYDTTHIGAGGIVYDPAGSITSYIFDAVELKASQTWDIRSGTLQLEGPLSDSVYNPETLQYVSNNYSITKIGAGALALNSYYTARWNGGLIVKDGSIMVSPLDYYYDYPVESLGTGAITFDSSGGGTPTLIATARLQYYYDYGNLSDMPVIIANPINLKGTFTSKNEHEVILRGDVTLQSDSTIKSRGKNLLIEGSITDGDGTYKLTIDSLGAVILDPSGSESSNEYDGGTHVERGVLVFADANAVPDNGTITSSATGYVGYGASGTVTTSFLPHINKANFLGTLGFDTESFSPIVISDDLNLDGFAASAKLGTASKATLTGNITPQGANYQFGGGGGFLQVDSKLTGARSVVVNSPSALPLTLRLTNVTNDFTGSISATHSGVILASNAAPASTTLQLGVGGYFGTEGYTSLEVTSDMPQAFINRFATNTANGMIGFDSTEGRTISTPINLSAFTGSIFIGTATDGGVSEGIWGGLTLTGTITTGNGGTDPYRFGAYKGGFLMVDTPLSGNAGVIIGDPTSPGTFADFVGEEYSKVALLGNNSALSGDVILHGGMLYGGNSNALGTGRLIVQGMTLPTEWQSATYTYPAPALAMNNEMGIANNVTLNTRLDILEDNAVSLTGKVSGTGSLYLQEQSELILSNAANDFTGGIYVATEAVLSVTADTATGTGKLGFGYSGGTALFSSASPVVHGIESDSFGAYIELER